MTEEERQLLKFEMILRFMEIFDAHHMCKMFAEMAEAALNGRVIHINSSTGYV